MVAHRQQDAYVRDSTTIGLLTRTTLVLLLSWSSYTSYQRWIDTLLDRDQVESWVFDFGDSRLLYSTVDTIAGWRVRASLPIPLEPSDVSISEILLKGCFCMS